MGKVSLLYERPSVYARFVRYPGITVAIAFVLGSMVGAMFFLALSAFFRH